MFCYLVAYFAPYFLSYCLLFHYETDTVAIIHVCTFMYIHIINVRLHVHVHVCIPTLRSYNVLTRVLFLLCLAVPVPCVRQAVHEQAAPARAPVGETPGRSTSRVSLVWTQQLHEHDESVRALEILSPRSSLGGRRDGQGQNSCGCIMGCILYACMIV